MPNFTFKLGALDLSPYTRVNPGEGLDPYSTEFVEPGFSDAPFSDGNPLTSLSVKNREMAIPLYLHGAANTKDQMHVLVQQIAQEVGKLSNQPLLVEWKDAGATNSTFYDVVYARFDPSFNFRAGEKGWLAGVLHVWTSGYGHTGTTRIAATGAGSGALITVPVPSIAGDVPPFLDVRFAEGSYFNPQGRIIGFAALPHASYAAKVPVASFSLLSGATVVGASGGDGSQALAITPIASSTIPWQFTVGLSPASVYAGRNHRVLIAAGRVRQQTTGLQAFFAGAQIGPSAIATSGDWSLLDLGVMRVPSSPAATLALTVMGAQHDPRIFYEAQSGATHNGHHNRLGPVYLLPEDAFTIISDSPRLPLALDTQPVSASIADIRNRNDDLGNPWATPAMGGTAAFISQGVVWGGDLGGFVPNWTAAGAVGRARSNHIQAVDIYAETTILDGGASTACGLFKECASQVFEAAVWQYNNGSYSLSLSLIDGGATTLLASLAIGAMGTSPCRLTLSNQGPVLAANLEHSTAASEGIPFASAHASIVSSHAQARLPGRAGIMGGASYALGIVPIHLWGFRVTGLPSQAQAASDMYEVDQVGQSFLRTSGANVDSLAARTRGRVRATPSTVAIAAISSSIDKGPMNDLLAVDVRVRERFFYAR